MKKNEVSLVVPGGVDEYIGLHSASVQLALQQMRAIIREGAPDAVETVSYFNIPGYSYPGYDYNGMFAWFSYVKPFVRLHVRPPVLENHQSELKGFKTTKAIVSFRADQPFPGELVLKLVVSSLNEMRGKGKV